MNNIIIKDSLSVESASVFHKLPLAKNKPRNLFDNHAVQLIEFSEVLLASCGVCRLMLHFT